MLFGHLSTSHKKSSVFKLNVVVGQPFLQRVLHLLSFRGMISHCFCRDNLAFCKDKVWKVPRVLFTSANCTVKPLPQITPNSYQKGREGGLIFVELKVFAVQSVKLFFDPFPSSVRIRLPLITAVRRRGRRGGGTDGDRTPQSRKAHDWLNNGERAEEKRKARKLTLHYGVC